MSARALLLLLLYGTAEAVTPPRLLRAGGLSAELEAGNLRYIRWHGVEMIRAIAYLVRGRVWNTVAPDIAELTIVETADSFAVAYTATIRDGAATLRYATRITGGSDGRMEFAADAVADSDFVTCRAGFVVLHPIVDVAGQPVEVEHTDGSFENDHFPSLIDPVQPLRDLRALTHIFAPIAAPGARVTCRMTGDTFEMEDQRNWTDASYKTYVRPLALPWPYTLAAGAPFAQSVALSVHGAAPAAPDADALVHIVPGPPLRPMPPLAIGCDPEEAAPARAHAALLRQVGVAALVCRFDPRAGHDAAALRAVGELAALLGAELELELVVPSVEGYAADIAAAAAQVRDASVTLAALAVSPAADLKSTSPGSVWPPCPPADAVLRAARAAFPGVPLGGGMLSTFTELNRKRPPNDLIDYITFRVTPNVHAGDDRSVMETLEALPAVAASVGRIARGLPWRIGPSSIGMRANPYGAAPLANPDMIRMAMAGRDPRQSALFNAGWTLGHIARFAAGGAARIALGGPAGDHGMVGPEGPYPVFHVIAGCAGLRGGTVHSVRTSREHDVLALLVATEDGRHLWLANLTAAPVAIALPEPFDRAVTRVLDASCGPSWTAWRTAPADARLQLDAYAVAALHVAALHVVGT